MDTFEIVAHRGIPVETAENTLAAFQRAIDLGADAVELDVRLTSDSIPVIYHYYYLEEITSAGGPIFAFTREQLKGARVSCRNTTGAEVGSIPTLREALEAFAGRIGLEIEIKGPEPEAPQIIGGILRDFKSLWDTMEITSYQPALLLAFQSICPGIQADLLYPRSPRWMRSDVMLYEAVHLSRLAHARAVHLHPSQLSWEAISILHDGGFEVHAWDVNDEESLAQAWQFGISRLCTDDFAQALTFRNELLKGGHRAD